MRARQDFQHAAGVVPVAGFAQNLPSVPCRTLGRHPEFAAGQHDGVGREQDVVFEQRNRIGFAFERREVLRNADKRKVVGIGLLAVEFFGQLVGQPAAGHQLPSPWRLRRQQQAVGFEFVVEQHV